MNPLDILSDLRGDDEATKVMGMLNDELKAAENENEKVSKENTMGIEPEEIEEKETEETDDTEKDFDTEENMLDEKPKKKKNKRDEKIKGLDNSFIGNTTTFTQSDFDDFNDLKEDMHITKIIIRILIFVIIVIFIIALVILANKYLGLGLF